MTIASGMIGLADAGKSTFLAAMYHVLESESVPGSLQLARIPPLREHLERIRQDWLICKPQTRTTAHVVEQNVVDVKTENGKSTAFLFPDLAGERLAALVEDRICEPELAQLLSRVNKVLLFVHPDAIGGSPTIDEVRNVMGGLQPNEGQAEPQPETVKPTAWDVVEMVSAQVKLVDLLQITNEFAGEIIKIGVVISAWDRVRSERLHPKDWVMARLPLLPQYLESRTFPVRFFGVSAAGGDPEKERDRLCKIATPADRIEVVGIDQGEDQRDITLPIKWLIA